MSRQRRVQRSLEQTAKVGTLGVTGAGRGVRRKRDKILLIVGSSDAGTTAVIDILYICEGGMPQQEMWTDTVGTQDKYQGQKTLAPSVETGAPWVHGKKKRQKNHKNNKQGCFGWTRALTSSGDRGQNTTCCCW